MTHEYGDHEQRRTVPLRNPPGRQARRLRGVPAVRRRDRVPPHRDRPGLRRPRASVPPSPWPSKATGWAARWPVAFEGRVDLGVGEHGPVAGQPVRREAGELAVQVDFVAGLFGVVRDLRTHASYPARSRLYVTASVSASQDAAITLSPTPTVPQVSAPPSLDSMRTRV